MKRIVAYIAVCLLACCCSREPAPELTPQETPAHAIQVPAGSIPGIITVKFKQEPFLTKASGPDLSALGDYTLTRTFPPAGKWEERHRRAGLHLWYDICFDESLPLSKAGASVSSLPEVEIMSFVPAVKTADDETVYPFNDPRLPRQWHYNNPGGEAQLAAGCDINAFKAWTIETGKPQVIVAVNDIGVDYAHEDLAANMWINEAEFNGKPGEDDDNNGYADDIYGFSFVTYDGKTPAGKIEPGDHGTHVAGTIAAVNNNGIGVCGVAGGDGTPGSGARIMCTQMMDGRNGALTPASVVYAADNGAVIINCSWSHKDSSAPTSAALSAAFDYFNEFAGIGIDGEQTGPMAGGLVVFAAGNEGVDVCYPSMDDNVFAVAALSANYIRSYYTNFGTWVDICAPGGDATRKTYVLSTTPDNTYGNMQGSSMAAPHVAGVAALLVSHYGVGRKGFTRDRLIYLMQSTSNKIALEENGSYATRLGSGLIDAYAALMAAQSTQQPETVKDCRFTVKSNAITLDMAVPGPVEGEMPYGYYIYYSKKSLAGLDPGKPADGVEKLYIISPGKAPGEIINQVISGLEFNTDYHFRFCTENFLNVLSPLSEEKVVKTGSNSKPVIEALDGTHLDIPSHATGTMRFRISDPDGHKLTQHIEGSPKGLSFEEKDDLVVLNINALYAEPGVSYNCVLQVTDGYVVVEQPISYKILNNNPPAVVNAIPDQIYTSTKEIRSFNLTDYFNDPDGESLSYSVESNSTRLIVNTELNGDELTVKGNSYGLIGLTVTATDARKATAEFSFRVLVRDAVSTYDLYPNPVTDFLNLRSGDYVTVDLKIINRAGTVVYEKAGVELSPFDPVKIDMRNLPGGVYYARLGDHKFTIAKQ